MTNLSRVSGQLQPSMFKQVQTGAAPLSSDQQFGCRSDGLSSKDQSLYAITVLVMVTGALCSLLHLCFLRPEENNEIYTRAHIASPLHILPIVASHKRILPSSNTRFIGYSVLFMFTRPNVPKCQEFAIKHLIPRLSCSLFQENMMHEHQHPTPRS